MRSLIDILDLSIEEIEELMQTASDIIAHPDRYAESCHGKKLATLFFEPSTRTRLSFEAAMLELGGNVIGFSEASSTDSDTFSCWYGSPVLSFCSQWSLSRSLTV